MRRFVPVTHVIYREPLLVVQRGRALSLKYPSKAIYLQSQPSFMHWSVLCGRCVYCGLSTKWRGLLGAAFNISLLKLVNSIIGMVGIALILYAIWMINVWYRKTVELPFRLSDFPAPWYVLFGSFFYYFPGFSLCLLLLICILNWFYRWMLKLYCKNRW